MSPAPPDDPAAAERIEDEREEFEELEDLGDPETSPAIPSAAVAVATAAAAALLGRRGDHHRATDREIWSLAWPVILSQVLASAVSLIDIAMVGRLTREAVAAVGYTTQFLWLMQSVLFAVGIACVALMARAIGAGDETRARRALAGSLILAVAIAAVVTTVVLAAPRGLLALLRAQPEVIDLAEPYLLLVLGSSPLLAVSIVLESAFRAVKDTRTPMVMAFVVTFVKTALNAVLIFGAFGFPRLELVGAGIATVASLAAGVVLISVAAARRRDHPALAVELGDFTDSGGMLREMLRISLPAVGERIVMNVAMMTYFALVGIYGSAALAAYTIGVRVLSFSWIPGIGFSVAASTLVGQALGAHEPDAASRAGWRSVGMAVRVSVAIGFFYVVFREPLARAFTSDLVVIDELLPFMLVLGIAQPLLGLHFTLGGALRGAGDTWSPLAAATLGNWAFRVPLAWVFATFLGAPVLWLWIAMVFDHLARALWLVVVFRRGRWRRRLGASV